MQEVQNGDGGVRAIDVMTFPKNERINTELFIERKQGLNIQNDIKKTF